MVNMLLAVFLLAGPPNPSSQEIELLLKHGDVERARQVASRVVAQAPSAQVEMLLGMASFELLDIDGARAAFRSALALDMDQPLPSWMNPRARALWEQERTALLARRLAETRMEEAKRRVRPHIGLLTMAGGAAAAGVGLAFGLLSRSAVNAAALEPSAAVAMQDHNTAVARAQLANRLFALGGLLGTVGFGLALAPTSNGAWFAVGGPW